MNGLKHLLIFVFICTGSQLMASSPTAIDDDSIKSMINQFFSDELQIDQSSLLIEFVRFPDISKIDATGNGIRITSQKIAIDIGYQTLWLELLKNDQLLKRYPVSVKVAVKTAVVVPVHNLNRGELITEGKLRFEQKILTRAYGTQVSAIDQITGLVTRRVIRAGTVIRKNMVRLSPDIIRGSSVNLEVQTGNIVLNTTGIIREDGNVGDLVAVFCPETRKLLAGVVQSPNLILVK